MFNRNVYKWLSSIKPLREFDLVLSSANSPCIKEPFMQMRHEAKGRDKKLLKTLWMTTFCLILFVCVCFPLKYYTLSKETFPYTDSIRGRLGKN